MCYGVYTGTGSAILAFFAIQAGARKVFAVEASDMAEKASRLVKANGSNFPCDV